MMIVPARNKGRFPAHIADPLAQERRKVVVCGLFGCGAAGGNSRHQPVPPTFAELIV